jgi:hypothetical protein
LKYISFSFQKFLLNWMLNFCFWLNDFYVFNYTKLNYSMNSNLNWKLYYLQYFVFNSFLTFFSFLLQWLFVSSFNKKTFKKRSMFYGFEKLFLNFSYHEFYVLEITIQFQWWQSFVNIVTNSLSFSICAFNKILLHNISFFEHIIHKVYSISSVEWFSYCPSLHKILVIIVFLAFRWKNCDLINRAII